MYSANGAVFRADISGVVMEAGTWEANLIGARVAPVVNVPTKDGQYPKFKLGTGNLLKREANIRRAPGSHYARGSLAYEQDTYATTEYGFELPLDYVDRLDTSRFFDAAVVTAEQAKRKILLDYEIRAAELTFNETNYGSATNSATAYTIANLATFDIGLDIDAAKGRLLGKGESDQDLSVVLSHDNFVRARASVKMQNRLRGIGVASDTILNIDEQAVAEALGVKEVLVGKNYYDTAAEGLAFASGAVWSNTYLWVGRLGSAGSPASMLNGGAQYTLNWSQYGPVLSVFEYEEPQSNATIIRASQHVTEKVVNANAGTLIATQYS
jgi:hypothetical protein